MMTDFKVTITEASKEISPYERVKLKDLSNAIKLDSVVVDGAHVTISPDFYAVLSVHNEKATPVDYENFLIVDKEGDKYVTGSPSFWRSFLDIAEELDGITDDYTIEVYKLDSKNYKGKQFLTCSLI